MGITERARPRDENDRMGILNGEVALVTGSTRGLGREIARVLAERGAAVAISGRDPERGRSAAAALDPSGERVVSVPGDLGTSAACDEVVARTTERLGPVSILVNNAYASDAIRDDAPAGRIDDATWDRIVLGNLTTAMWLTRAVLPGMVTARRGSIVNVSARAGVVGTPGMAAHSASKGGLNALTRSVAVDYAGFGIRCNAVVPGHVLHDERDAEISDRRRAMLEAMHLTRLATATDVAFAVAYLAGPEAEVLTGVLLPVDGGSTAARAASLGGPDPRTGDG